MELWTFIFAQESPTVVPGFAGWLSAGTGIGLLSGVLYWLCWYHIPKILENHKEAIQAVVDTHKQEIVAKNLLITTKDTQIIQLVRDKDTAVTQVVKDFKEEMRESRQATKDQYSLQKNTFQETLSSMKEEAKEEMVAERQECTKRMAEMVQAWKTQVEEEKRRRGPHEEAKMAVRRDYLLIVHVNLMIITTFLKIVMICILCFYVAPGIERSAEESRLNRNQVMENRELMREVGDQIRIRSEKLDETFKMAVRIQSLLDAIDKQYKDLEEKKKRDKEREDREKLKDKSPDK